MDKQLYNATDGFLSAANIDSITYQKMYEEALANPEPFWAQQAKRLTWFKPWNRVFKGDFNTGEISWFEGGKINACYNCLDRHLDIFHKKPH